LSSPALPLLYSGKVRDIYDAGDGHLLFVASDRISVFDVVLAEPIPDKGRVLTAMTVFWLDVLKELAPNHMVSVDVADFPSGANEIPDVPGRAMLVRKAEMLPIECIVRGYISGSAWAEYKKSGTMHGAPLPAGMKESEKLPEPVFTPSTKAQEGHDENIDFDTAAGLVGRDTAEAVRDLCIAAYQRAADLAESRGIIIADTKFELGWIDGRLALCDEILTPDSSRFWPADEWQPGSAPPSFDKQPVRDALAATGWNKQPPPPALADDIVRATHDRYVTIYERITGKRFADWPGAGA
jgi:phosphoribosylaminoimidazole-succinocarboxamide synthase